MIENSLFEEIKLSNRKNFAEEDIKLRYITPALEKVGWAKEHIRMEYFFTEGQILVKSKIVERGKRKKADYLLRKDGKFPLVVVEAKKLEHTADNGLQQARDYAKILNLLFAYSPNGKKFIEHNFLTGTEREFPMSEFPTEEELWKRYCVNEKFLPTQEKIIRTSDHFDKLADCFLNFVLLASVAIHF